MQAPDRVVQCAMDRLPQTLGELEALSRIPSVSAPGFPPSEVSRCAREVARLLEEVGLQKVELLGPAGVHPYVVAEWTEAGPEKPTLLLYAHYDVQPPGRETHWHSPPFDPEKREGRLYGRGVVDDKAGILILISAVRAWFESEGTLPVNVKFVVEGEEEIGSTHLESFLLETKERLSADIIVLTDTANLETGLPSLTTSLRGLVNVDVHVKLLDHPLHSGMWGGPIGDAATALTALLGRLFDAQGEVILPGLSDDVPELSQHEKKALAELPFSRASFRTDAGLMPGSRTTAASEASVYEQLWNHPAVAITALEAIPLDRAANQLIDSAAARVSVRLAPGQNAERVRDLLVEFLSTNPPFGAQVTLECEAAVPGWRRSSEGSDIEAARRALARGYGREPVLIGCGGSIPFVAPFSRALSGAPAVLLGLEDPICNAHGENESLHLGDFRSALISAVHLLAEFSDFLEMQAEETGRVGEA